MRSVILALLALIPVVVTGAAATEAPQLQCSAQPAVGQAPAVAPAAGAGDTATADQAQSQQGQSQTQAQQGQQTGQTAPSAPSQYLSLAQSMSTELVQAVSSAVGAVLDYLRGRALHEPVRPEDLMVAITLPALKAVIQQKLQELGKALTQIHLGILASLQPNTNLINLMQVAAAAAKEYVKAYLQELSVVKDFKDTIESYLKQANNELEESAFRDAESALNSALDHLANYLSMWLYVLLSKPLSLPGL